MAHSASLATCRGRSGGGSEVCGWVGSRPDDLQPAATADGVQAPPEIPTLRVAGGACAPSPPWPLTAASRDGKQAAHPGGKADDTVGRLLAVHLHHLRRGFRTTTEFNGVEAS
ncbi:hypothetical protein Misp03_36700 [Microbispora sp. NBRC 16548]|nr:hypothetical protein Misp03_36700 [Microbispora sp. NBRC 16548]